MHRSRTLCRPGAASVSATGRLILHVFVVAALATCEGDHIPPDLNASPRLTGPIPHQVFEDSVVLDLTAHFDDPDGDALTFTATSSNTAAVRVDLAGAVVTLVAIVKGSAAVTVTATDSDGETATHGFPATVPNRAPRVVIPLPDAEAFVGDRVAIALAGYFTDPDQDSLTFSAETSDAGVATVELAGDEVTVAAHTPGLATITVAATDSEGLATTQDFVFTVPNRAPRATDPVPGVEVQVGEGATQRMSGHFMDPDGEELAYAAESSDGGVAGVVVFGDEVTVSAVAKGMATITVTATDPGGLAAVQDFPVRVPNRAPHAVDTLPDIEVEVGGVASETVSRYFADPDGDSLVFTVGSLDEAVATVGVADDLLTVRAVAKGVSTITVTAEDPERLAAALAFEVRVPNRPPLVTGVLPDVIVEVGEMAGADLTEHFTEPDGDELFFAAESSDPAVAAASISNSRVTVGAVAKGAATVTITAADSEGLAVEQRFLVTVPNRPPLGTHPLPELEVQVGEEWATDLSEYFADPDGDTLRFAAESSDSTIALAHVSEGRVTVSALARGTVTVTVRASDPEDLAATGAFRVVVPNRAPVATDALPDIVVEVGDEASTTLSRYFADPDDDSLGFTVGSFDEAVATAGVSDDRLTVRAVAKGMSTITVTAEDSEGLAAVLAFEVRVPNRPPRVTGMLPDMSVEVGDTAGADLTEHFTEPDGDELVFAAESSDPAVAAASISGDRMTVGAGAKGVATVAITATDSEGLAVEQSFLVTVPNRAPQGTHAFPDLELQAGEGSATDLTEHFSDPDGDTLRFTAESSDSTVAVAHVSGGRVTVSALARGRVTVTVTASDPEELAATGVFQVTVPNGAPRVHAPMPDRRLEADGVIEMSLPDHFSDPDGDSLVFKARSSDSSVVSVGTAGSGLTIEAVAKGQAEITVTAADPANLEVESEFTVRVPNREPRIVRTLRDWSIAKGGRTTLRPSRYFSDPDGDSLSFAAESSDTTIVAVQIHRREIRIRGVKPGRSTVTITATDSEGLATAQSFGVTVERRNAPETQGSIPDQSLEPGAEVTMDVSEYFTDPDGDALTFAAKSSDPALATATISDDQLTIVAVDTGTATVTVTATDPGGLYAMQSLTVTVTHGPGNQAPRRAGRIADRGLYEGDEITFDVSGYFTDPDGDQLTFAAASSNPGVAAAVVSGGELTLNAVSAGTANVVVIATDPGDLSATQPFAVRVRQRGVTGDFDISLHFTDAVPAAHRPTLEEAASWWRSVLSDTEWTDVTVNGTTECRDVDVPLETVDDLVILVDLVEIDGDLGTAARAGVCVKRDEADAFAPVLGYVRFDKADIDVLAQYGDLWEVMVHEITHVLGFGVRWVNMDLLDQESDPHFTGARALAAFDAAGGTDYPGAKVPTQPGQGHWRESVFGSELLTSSLFINRREPLSAITLAALMDMGYHVDLSFADDYELDGPEADLSGMDARPAFDFSDDIGRGPEIIVDRDGNILRVIPGRRP